MIHGQSALKGDHAPFPNELDQDFARPAAGRQCRRPGCSLMRSLRIVILRCLPGFGLEHRIRRVGVSGFSISIFQLLANDADANT
jgi:hypothetical protein